MSQAGLIDIESSHPQIPTSFVTDNGTAIPLANVLEILATTVSAGVNSKALTTKGSGNTVTAEIQLGTAIAAADSTKAGVVTFESTDFTVSDGHVTLAAGSSVSSLTTDVSGPVLPSAAGAIAVTGTSIFSDGTAASTLTLNVQSTANTFLVGAGSNSTSTELGPLTDGQLIIGANDGAPTAASLTQPAAGFTIVGGTNSVIFTLTDDLAAVEGLATTGMAARTASNTWTTRTITGTTDFIEVADGDGVAGNPTISISENFEKTGMDGWNGSILETVDGDVSSDGATITYSVQQSGGGDLTVVFSDGYYTWDTTPADTVTLTAGSDTSPTLNYVYFLQSTKTLTASTAGWPATEHAPLATVLCQSAASLQTDLAYKDHAWTDHVVATNDMGHIADINFWIRQQPATYVSGIVQTYDINSVTDPDEVTIATTSGVALQLHDHAVPAFVAADDYYVVNDSVTPFLKITDLNAIDADSTGATLVGRYYSLVMWIAVSEDTGECKRFINLPSGSYNNSTGVENDSDGFANYTIPNDFVGTGILVSEWKLRRQAAASGTFTSIAEIDLRGLLPSLTAGGGSGAGTEFADNTFRIFDDGDNTKEIAFEASGITTATTRTLTVPDASGTIALASGLAANGFAYALDVNTIDSTAAATNGQLLIGSTGVAPVAATLTDGTGISTTLGAGSITINATGGGFTWNDVTGTSDTLVASNGYIANNAGLVTLTLPATCAVGDVMRVVGKGAGGWSVAQNASQVIHFGITDSTTGVGGSLASTNRYDCLEILCVATNTDFLVISSIGNITVT